MSRFRMLALLCLAWPFAAQAQDAAEGAPAAGLAAGNDHVARALFTTGIKDREPADSITTLTVPADKVYFFTELRGLSGHTVSHRWTYQGKTMASVDFHVGGPRWRVWSKKTLLPRWTGDWQVAVIDQDGAVLATETLHYSDR